MPTIKEALAAIDWKEAIKKKGELLFAIKRDKPSHFYRKDSDYFSDTLDEKTVYTGRELAERLAWLGERYGPKNLDGCGSGLKVVPIIWEP